MCKIEIKEHQNLYAVDTNGKLYKYHSYKENLENKYESVLFKKNNYDCSNKDDKISKAYHVGIDWLIESELALIVKPKIDNLDYLKMFMTCFQHLDNEVTKYLKDAYHIDLDKKSISLDSNPFEITPLLIIHYIKVLENLVKRGLKKDYIRREENLNSKIKGKIVFSKHLKKNIAQNRADRVFCNYQDYSVDCLENRVLKKALQFAQSYMQRHAKSKIQPLQNSFHLCQAAFQSVTNVCETRTLRQFKVNRLYRDYAEALALAKLILQRFSYNLQEAAKKEQHKTPPFWIDMTKLFELYVLGLLKDAYPNQIIFQFKANYGEPDFLKTTDEKIMILDTKYKPYYDKKFKSMDKIQKEIVAKDIRQLSGYARDKKILDELKLDCNCVIPCVIIYPICPDPSKAETETINLESKEPIKQFSKFYKIGVKLPT